MIKHGRNMRQRSILWLIALIILAFFLYPLIMGLNPGISSANNTITMCGNIQTTSFCETARRTAGNNRTKFSKVSSHTATSPKKVSSSNKNTPNKNTAAGQTPTPTISTTTAWNLVWSDEFSSSTLDTTKWTALDGGNFYTPATSEDYAPDDTYVQPGQGLIFKSEERSYNGYNYTSGGVSSRDKFSLLYGKIECRVQLPQGKGLWPSIWLMPENGSDSNEIDMLELLGNDTHDVQMNYHWLDAGGNRQEDISHFVGSDFSMDYHTFDLEWTPSALSWSIDGVVVKKITTNILSTPMFLYINTAIGANGTWPGPPDSTTSFPQYTKISYVRVYKAT